MSEPVISLSPLDIISQFNLTDQVERYWSLLSDENSRVNLVSRETSRADFDRLVAESLVPFINKGVGGGVDRYLDIGSGGGLPAIPLLLAGLVDGEAILVERTLKKAEALRRLVSGLELNAEVIARTIEELNFREPFNLSTLRLVKLTPPLLKRIVRLLAPEARLVYYAATDLHIDSLTRQTISYAIPPDSPAKQVTIFQKS